MSLYRVSLTYATLRVNFPPLVSSVCSCFPVSVLYRCILPAWLPETMYLSSGEKTTVQISTGPTSMLDILSPVSKSQSFRLESRELDAQPADLNSDPKFHCFVNFLSHSRLTRSVGIHSHRDDAKRVSAQFVFQLQTSVLYLPNFYRVVDRPCDDVLWGFSVVRSHGISARSMNGIIRDRE